MSQGISDNRLLWGDEPTEVNGIPLYPIRMERYMEWLDCKRALTVRQKTLPAAYAILPYLSALYAMDFDTKGATGFMAQTVRLLAMATQQPVETFEIRCDSADMRKLTAIVCQSPALTFRIEPSQFAKFRIALAQQNGADLPDEAQNPELVEAENDIAEQNNVPLKADVNDLLASVAYQCHVRLRDIAEWSIREFEAMRRAIDRDKRFALCAQAEAAGAKYKSGNPCPSWCFDRERQGHHMESLSGFSERTGMNANVPVNKPS